MRSGDFNPSSKAELFSMTQNLRKKVANRRNFNQRLDIGKEGGLYWCFPPQETSFE